MWCGLLGIYGFHGFSLELGREPLPSSARGRAPEYIGTILNLGFLLDF